MKKLIPDMGMITHPIETNPTPSARQQRNQARMQRLREAIASGDPRPGLREELARREKEGR